MKKRTLLLVAIIFFGTVLRFTNLNWDSYLAFHPDERNISWAVTRIHFFDQMNPKFFAYGGLPIYLYRALAELVTAVTHNTNWIYDWGHIAVIGRYVSAILSSISILLIYLVAARFFSKTTGLLSAFFLAFSPWAIREAHFSTTETMLVFFVLLLLLLSIPLRLPRPPHGLAMTLGRGIVLGLAIAAKTTGVLFALIPLSAIFFSLKRQSLSRIFLQLLLLAGTTGMIFLLFSPYTILDWQHFTESMKYESGVALGQFPVPYTYQFLNTVPYLYQIKTMLWQAGPVAIIGLVNLILLAFFTVKRKNHTYAIFLIFPLVYFLWAGSWYTKFSRYNVPLLPFLTISASWLLVKIRNKFHLAGLACLAIVASATFLWGLANWTIYARTQTRIAASLWMVKHIPAEAIIYTEHWNDGLPVYTTGSPVINYHRELINSFDLDNDQKKAAITKQLGQGDYLIFSTRRIWGTMPKLTDRYPFTSALYQKILNGETEYKEVASFASYPSLFGITINDDAAEESMQVFDHPTVRIFERKNAFSL